MSGPVRVQRSTRCPASRFQTGINVNTSRFTDPHFLATHRVNAGTALYVGYNDHYRQFERFDEQVNITEMGYRQTNRAVFTKFQYLFRY